LKNKHEETWSNSSPMGEGCVLQQVQAAMLSRQRICSCLRLWLLFVAPSVRPEWLPARTCDALTRAALSTAPPMPLQQVLAGLGLQMLAKYERVKRHISGDVDYARLIHHLLDI
jgi:hypothetical protein